VRLSPGKIPSTKNDVGGSTHQIRGVPTLLLSVWSIAACCDSR
jgi:hypothetical protein